MPSERMSMSDASTRPTAAVKLTPRERDVVAAILDGATDKDVSARIGVTEQTVKNHLSRIFKKLGVANRLELALYAVHHRLFSGTRHPRASPSGGPAAPPRHSK